MHANSIIIVVFHRTYITGNGAYFLCLAAIFAMAFAIEVLNFHRYNI